MNTDGHPAYTRYPHLMGKNYYGVAGDYINSKDNLRFTPWKRTFAFKRPYRRKSLIRKRRSIPQ